MDFAPFNQYLPPFEHPLVISGPCSVETEEQVNETAQGLAQDTRVKVLRGGIWKPRTRPNQFEGVGDMGLPWLVQAAKSNGFLSTTEVANAHHVEAALKAGVDILWIGARTTVNPFSVQEIADALKGVDVPVWIKNPVNPDLQLWLGAIERVYGAGIHKIAAIHRGFSSSAPTPYRNAPRWELAIELKRLLPELPFICDPSHICGRRDLLQHVAQKALDLEMQGLMLESHRNPDAAWSDAKQQVTPSRLTELLSDLVLRSTAPTQANVHQHLQNLREQVDLIDEELLEKMAARMNLVSEIGKYKSHHGITILQMDRWRTVIEKWNREGLLHHLDSEFIHQLLQVVHKESIRLQTEVMNQPERKK
ncbi:MAG TPA: chorismate mutase [Luteibaculaceae bacterium]|nr:chorismate mutase [Luteibaculaceae bacterium]